MIKKRQSRATKAVLASLLAVSLALPTFASATSVSVSANAETALINSITTIDDGTYEVVPAMTKGMGSHFQEPAKLIIKDGKMTVQLVIVEKSNSMVGSLQTERDGNLVEMDVVEGDVTTATRTVSFPVEELGKAIHAHVVVNVPPNPAMPDGRVMPHDFEITINSPAVEVPAEEVQAETVSVTVFKDGTNEESVMTQYIEPTVSITKSDTGHAVTITIAKNQEQYIHGFKVNGQEASKGIEDGKTTYTFEVNDTKSLATAELHVIVDVAGVKYDSTHKVQIGFGALTVEKPTPEQPEEGQAQTVSVTVFKDGTNEESVMTQYIEPTVSITKSDIGHAVTITIVKNQEQYIHGFKVNGQEASKGTKDGKTTYTFEVNDTKSLATAELHVIVDAAGVKYDSTHKVQIGFGALTVEKPTPEQPEEKPTPEKPEEGRAETVSVTVFKDGTREESVMAQYIEPTVSITKSDTGHAVTITIARNQEQYIHGFKVNGQEARKGTKDGKTTYTFEVNDTKSLATAELHVIVDAAGVKYDSNHKVQIGFGALTVEKPTPEKPVVKPTPKQPEEKPTPEKPEEVKTQTVSVTVFKDGTKEESVMTQYIEPTVSITKSDTGHAVTITIVKNQEQYIHGFKVNGQEASKGTKDGKTTYTFEVNDTKSLATAELHVIVDAAGVKYDSNHKVQISFGALTVEQPEEKPTPEKPSTTVNPFTDIANDGNKDAILALLNKGIIKEAANFNPRNDITRAQFALMIARALDLKATESAGFKDVVNLTDKERVDAINALAAAGIVQKNENFNPNKPLTRQQGALMLYRAVAHVAGQEITMGDPSLSYYADGKSVTDKEAQKAFALLYAAGAMTGSPQPDGKVVINANSSLKRTQMAKILNGSLEFMSK